MLTYRALAADRRAGERAAVSGLGWLANPYLAASNMPKATGEQLQDWGRRHDAWQAGHAEGSRHDASPAGSQWTRPWRPSA
jgi:hypothetical protein